MEIIRINNGEIKKITETRRFRDGQGTLLSSVELSHATFYQCKLAQFCIGCKICAKISITIFCPKELSSRFLFFFKKTFIAL